MELGLDTAAQIELVRLQSQHEMLVSQYERTKAALEAKTRQCAEANEDLGTLLEAYHRLRCKNMEHA